MKLPRFIGRPGLRVARSFFRLFGFELVEDYKPPQVGIKDYDYYRPLLCPWLMPEWKVPLRADDPRSLLPLQAKYIFYSLALDATRWSKADVAECGVYKGGTAKILAEIVPDRPIYLFDTFKGMPETDASRDLHKAGDFADTDINSVREYLSGHNNVSFFPGLIPHSLDPVRDRTFSFVHVDLDIYTAIKSACEFFYPRLEPGGILLFDDYGYASCPGARVAVDEFFADKPEIKISIPTTGQCSVRKLG